MAQSRFYEYGQNDLTALLIRVYLGIFEPGVYRGFDFQPEAGLTLKLNMDTGVDVVLANGDAKEYGVILTKQGIVIQEDAIISLPITATAGAARTDLIYCSHTYQTTTGGAAAVYSIVQGADGGARPTLPTGNNTAIGYLVLPASCSSLTVTGVKFEKVLAPALGGQKLALTSSVGSLLATVLTDNSTVRQTLNLGGRPAFDLALATPTLAIDTIYTGMFNYVGNILVEHKGSPYTPEATNWNGFANGNEDRGMQLVCNTDGAIECVAYRFRVATTWGAWKQIVTGFNEPVVSSSNGTIVVTLDSTPTIAGRAEYDLKAGVAELGVQADLAQFLETGNYMGIGPARNLGTYFGPIGISYLPANTYAVNDNIFFDNRIWKCISAAAAGETPFTHSSKWLIQKWGQLDLNNNATWGIRTSALNDYTLPFMVEIANYTGAAVGAGEVRYYNHKAWQTGTGTSTGQSPDTAPSLWDDLGDLSGYVNYPYWLEVLDKSYTKPGTSIVIRQQIQRISFSFNSLNRSNAIYQRLVTKVGSDSTIFGTWMPLNFGTGAQPNRYLG